MTTGGDELFVTIGGKDVGLEDILRRVDAEMQVSADQAVRLGQQYARLAQAQGQPAAASQILAGTIGQASSASEKALLGIETQAARIGQGAGYFQQFGQVASSNLAAIVGPAAAATAAIGALKTVEESFGDALHFAGALQEERQAFGGILGDIAKGNAVLSQATQIGHDYGFTQQQITDAFKQLAPIIRESTSSTQSQTEALARISTLDPEKPVQLLSQAIEGLQKGRFTAIAAEMGLTKAQASEMTQAVASGKDAFDVLNAALDRQGLTLDVARQRMDGYAGAERRAAQAQEDLKLAQAQFAQGPGLAILQAQIQATTGATRVLSGNFEDARRSITDAAQAGSFGFHLFDTIMAGTLSNIATYQNAADQSAAASRESAAATDAWNAELARSGVITTGVTDIEQQRLNVLNAIAALSQQATAASLGYADALELTDVRARAAAEADQLKANADQLASVNAQTHSVAMNALAQQAQIAAQALLSAGPAGASTAATLAGSSSQVDVLTAAYYRLAAAQAAAGAAATKAKLDSQTARELTGADSDEAGIRAQRRAVIEDERTQRIKAAQDAADAEARYQAQLGNQLPTIARLKAARDQMARDGRTGEAAYFDILTKIDQAEDKQAKNDKRGRGAGGTRLSDQQKLQNSLLASQENYEQKSEDATTQHAIEVEKINQDFYAKMLAAQKDFDQAQLDDRASFYDQQGSIESASVRQAASAAYEQASVEAGKIAQEKGADVANKYMDAQEQIINARAKRQDEIEKLSNKKDKKTYDPDRAEYLKGVDAEYQKAEDAKLARIKEGEGSLAAEKQKQLDDAAAKEADAQDKIGLSADRAADRKVAASERAGKKIDEEALKVDDLSTKYDRLGAAGARAGITPAASTPAASTPAPSGATSAAAPVANADAVVAAIEGLKAAIAAVEKAVNSSGDKVAGALKVRVAN